MANTQYIKEGITFHFFVHAIFVALLGAVGFVPGIPNFFRVMGIVFLALAILLLLVETGISVDKKNGRVRKYFSLFSIRFGEWVYLSRYEKIILESSKETLNHMGTMHSPSSTSSLTYEIMLKNNTNSFELYEFTEYEVAKRMFEELAQHVNLPCENSVDIKRKSALNRRRR
jgi:hypothetical protein